MQNALNSVLAQLAALLGPLSPATKAVVPAALSLAQLLVGLAITGTVSTVQLTIAATGLAAAVLVYALPNLTRKTTAPVIPAAAPATPAPASPAATPPAKS